MRATNRQSEPCTCPCLTEFEPIASDRPPWFVSRLCLTGILLADMSGLKVSCNGSRQGYTSGVLYGGCP